MVKLLTSYGHTILVGVSCARLFHTCRDIRCRKRSEAKPWSPPSLTYQQRLSPFYSSGCHAAPTYSTVRRIQGITVFRIRGHSDSFNLQIICGSTVLLVKRQRFCLRCECCLCKFASVIPVNLSDTELFPLLHFRTIETSAPAPAVSTT